MNFGIILFAIVDNEDTSRGSLCKFSGIGLPIGLIIIASGIKER